MPTAPLIPKIPPLRTDIQEPQQSSAVNRPPAQGASANQTSAPSNGGQPQHRTSKEWYYYWSKVGERVVSNSQKLDNLVTYGTHAARPDPSTMPDGALYFEEDRGLVEYENIAGKWYYVAGTMWGTLSPDQRPTDLGVTDAGFEFRSVDANAAYAPRTFVWSQAAWIETTLVLYGTHAARPAADQKTPPRTLYIETDRGNVTYQQQANAWVYAAGVMLGTLSPDQRPTGLGANDKGFQFRATDQNQQFYWSGSAWVQTTPPVLPATQSVVTASRALGGIYQNTGTTPRYASVGVIINGGSNVAIQAYCDASASPGTIVTASYGAGVTVSTMAPLFFIILPGYYYKVVSSSGSGATLNVWTEWQ